MTLNASKESIIFTFKGQKPLLGCLTLEDEGATLVWKVDNPSPKTQFHIPWDLHPQAVCWQNASSWGFYASFHVYFLHL